jgi:trans-aconitate 2-methyltransferase
MIRDDHPHDRYTFGDSDLAAHRLRLLAALYEPSSAGLLRLCTGLAARRAVDLGCGPGWSTRLVHAVIGPAVTLGVDASAEHIARAEEVVPPGIEFRVHDVRGLSFPDARPDFLYCRFLLTHLREPERALAAWAEAAADEATLVIEETETVESDHPAFARYYTLVNDLQRHYGQRHRIGAELAAPPPGSGWKAELSTVRRLALPARQMARLHHLNLLTWRDDPHARDAFDRDELEGLGATLAGIARGDEGAPCVRSAMRQLVLTKA